MLRASDYAAASTFLLSLHGCRDATAFPRLVARDMLPLVGGDQTGWNELAASVSWVRVIAHPPLQDAGWVNRALVAHLHEHPVARVWREKGDMGGHAISDFLSTRAYHRSGIYQGFYREFGHEDQLSRPLTPPNGHAAVLAFNRGRRGFSARDREMLEFLAPHVLQAWRNVNSLARAERALAGHREVVSALGQQVLELDRRWRVRGDYPARAQRWLRTYFPDAPLHGASELPVTLVAWVRQCLSHDGWSNRLRPLVRQRGARCLTIRCFPLDDGGTLLSLEERTLVKDDARLRAQGLTRREVEVLVEIEVGKTNAEIAAALSLSPATVKKHLDNIYAKLGVSNRVAAVNWLRSG